MRVCILGSGSKGNSTYIETENSKILIDAGLSNKELEKRLGLLHVNPDDIDAILITHEHSDHIKGVEQFSKEHKTKVFANRKSWDFISNKYETIPLNLQIEFSGHDFVLNDLAIQTFDVDHDSLSCVGFSVTENDKTFSIATDLGHITPEIIKILRNSDFVVLESNHDVNMLRNNKNYSYVLKQRILSNHGHISNDTCAETIFQMLGCKTRGVILGHLSEQNNTPSLALSAVERKMIENNVSQREIFYVDVASQNKPTNIFKIKNSA